MELVTSEKNKKKIVWISILQGFTMLLVVIGHSDLAEKETYPVIGLIYKLFRSFRMPLFVLISGYLFWLTRISKNKDYSFVVLDKLKRLGIPFVFFTFIGVVAKYVASAYIKHPMEDIGPSYFLNILIGLKESPLGALWFVYVTFMLMLLYPFYQKVLDNKYISLLVVGVGIIMNEYPLPIPYFKIERASSLFVYFFVGMLIGKYGLDRYVKPDIKIVSLFVVTYFALFGINYISLIPVPTIMLSFWGITMAFHLAKYAEIAYPTLFSSFRYNTYQIYLISVFPQMLIEMFYRQMGSHYFMLFYIANIFIGLYFPIVVVKAVEKINLKMIRPCIGL